MSSLLGSIVRGVEAPAFTGSEQQKLSAPHPSTSTSGADAQAVQQVTPPPDRIEHSPKGSEVQNQNRSPGGEKGRSSKNKEIELEEREFDFQDGQLTVKVYDRNGKLLRQVPPGYVPLDLSA